MQQEDVGLRRRLGGPARGFSAALAVVAASLLLCTPVRAQAPFGFDDVAREAEALSRTAYQAPPPADARLSALTYDDYRRVQFRPDGALWRGAGTPFDVRFYPLGRGNTRPLRLFEVVDGAARPIGVPAAAFGVGDLTIPRGDGPPAQARSDLPVDSPTGVAGFRLNYPLNRPDVSDELISFLGSSYFRALGSGLRYGASARGLAVDSASGRGEEFPVFTSFWLQRPEVGAAGPASQATLFAVLDSPSVAGAYRFTVRPGATTTVDVQARLFPRGEAGAVATFGIAPLTSMFLAGENQPTADDYRPEVHDSDGLQVHTADGEWIWRPLTNPRPPFTTSFAMRSPRGFGLMQRDRAFTSYEDLEASYELRPSVWVEPLGEWGPGRVELLQFGTPNETHDNVVAYWVPERAAGTAPDAPLDFSWRLHWSSADAVLPPGAYVVQSRRGHGYRETPIPAQRMQFHIDFAGPALRELAAGAAGAGGTTGAGPVVDAPASGNDNVRELRAIAYPNPVRGGWRVTLAFERIDPARPVELRTYLRQGERTLSETWSYALAPA